MKLFKLILRDMRLNSCAVCWRMLITVLFFAVLYFAFVFEVFHYFYDEIASPLNINMLGVNVGDLILVEIGGTLPQTNATQTQVIAFPTAFFLVHILPCSFVLNYLHDDIYQGGIQVFTRLGNMKLWWISKCIRCSVTVLLYYAVGFVTWALLCLATGKSLALVPNSAIFERFFHAYFTNTALPPLNFIFAMLVTPALVTATLSLCEITLTLFIRPIYAFLTICLYYILGIFVLHPACLSNYAMPVRNSAIGVYNFSSLFGLGLCLVVIAAAVVLGAVRLHKFDIVGERN